MFGLWITCSVTSKVSFSFPKKIIVCPTLLSSQSRHIKCIFLVALPGSLNFASNSKTMRAATEMHRMHRLLFRRHADATGVHFTLESCRSSLFLPDKAAAELFSLTSHRRLPLTVRRPRLFPSINSEQNENRNICRKHPEITLIGAWEAGRSLWPFLCGIQVVNPSTNCFCNVYFYFWLNEVCFNMFFRLQVGIWRNRDRPQRSSSFCFVKNEFSALLF